MAQIVLDSVVFSYTPATNQQATVYYKLPEEDNYTVWTTTANILPNGDFSPLVAITGLLDGTTYDIRVIACGTGSDKDMTSSGVLATTSTTTTTTGEIEYAVFTVVSWAGPITFQAGAVGPLEVEVAADRAYDQDVVLTLRLERNHANPERAIHVGNVVIPAGQTDATYFATVYREGVYDTCIITAIAPQFITSGGVTYRTY